MAWRLRNLVRRIVAAVRAGPQAKRPGELAEDAAARYLEGQAARIIARNVRCRGGEIDLIIEDRGTIAFVEVRLRSSDRHGGAAASITHAKQRRLVNAASYWRRGAGRRYSAQPCRFDAVLLDGGGAQGIEWLRGAFAAG